MMCFQSHNIANVIFRQSFPTFLKKKRMSQSLTVFHFFLREKKNHIPKRSPHPHSSSTT
ncbi:uncharacterized protein LY79DRAFT_558639, partial [Colletotrichum navitas]